MDNNIVGGVGPNVVAVVQSSNQYMTGLVGGYLVDQLMNQIPITSDNVYGRMGRQLLQTVFNGVALHYMLKFIHGANPRNDYCDPTGGYMLLVGLIQAQPSYMKNGKELILGLTSFLKEMSVPITGTHVVTEQETQAKISVD